MHLLVGAEQPSPAVQEDQDHEAVAGQPKAGERDSRSLGHGRSSGTGRKQQEAQPDARRRRRAAARRSYVVKSTVGGRVAADEPARVQHPESARDLSRAQTATAVERCAARLVAGDRARRCGRTASGAIRRSMPAAEVRVSLEGSAAAARMSRSRGRGETLPTNAIRPGSRALLREVARARLEPPSSTRAGPEGVADTARAELQPEGRNASASRVVLARRT